MTINRINWEALDGHDNHAADSRFMQDEIVDQIERRFRAITYKNGVDTNGIARGLELASVTDTIVVGTGVAYDNSTRSRIVLEDAVILEPLVSEVGRYVVIENEEIDDDPIAMRMEAHPETGVVSPCRRVYRPKVSIVAAPSASTQIKLGKIVSYTAGQAPVLSTQAPDRTILSLGTQEGQLTSNPVVVVAADNSGDFTDIQQAIDSLPTTGGHIHVKAGEYRVNAVMISKNGVRIEGSGSATRILVDPPPISTDPTRPTLRPGVGFIVGDDTQLLDDDLNDSQPGGENRTKETFISNLYFDTVPVSQSALGSTRDPDGNPQSALEESRVQMIRVCNGHRVWIEDCHFRDTHRASIESDGIFIGNNSSLIVVRRCDFQGLSSHIRGGIVEAIVGGAGNRKVAISSSTCSGDALTAGLYMDGTLATLEWVIVGNIIQGPASHGILADRDAAIVGNVTFGSRNGIRAGSTGGTKTNKTHAGTTVVGNCSVLNQNYGVDLATALFQLVWSNNLSDNSLGGTNPSVADESNVISNNIT